MSGLMAATRVHHGLLGPRREQSSGRRCLFLFAVERDDQGRDVFQQLAAKLA